MASSTALYTDLRTDLGNALKYLKSSLEELTAHVRERSRAVWVWRPGEALAPRVALPALSREKAIEAATRALLTLEYQDTQDAHESRIAPGLIVLEAEGIKLADEVNGWKVKLAAALKAMNGLEAEGIVNRETGERGPRPLREVALEALGSARLHYRQAVRKITVLRESAEQITTPDRVSFTWSSCKTVRRTTREALIADLSARVAGERGLTETLERDLAKLTRLPAGEPIALAHEAPLTVRANVAWAARGTRPRLNASFSAVAPVVMLGDALPKKFTPLSPAPPPKEARKARNDTELEDTQLLEAVPAFRYLRNFREAKHAESA